MRETGVIYPSKRRKREVVRVQWFSCTHYPPRLDCVVRAEFLALEAADADIVMDRIRLVSFHLKDSHGALVDALSTAEAE
jgi:hypothetical protein